MAKTLKVKGRLAFRLFAVTSADELLTEIGHGRYTTGGRAGDTYTVTVKDGAGAGTLAYGIANAPEAGRTILFAVNGTTDNQTIVTTKSNITIDGSSAPGGGFCFRGRIQIGGNNWIIKNIRVRPGRQADPSINTHPIWFLSPTYGTNVHLKNFVLKNVSVTWGNDEHVVFSGCSNITIQNCLIGEPIFDAFPPVYGSQSVSALGLYKCENVTVYQNVFLATRTPLAGGVKNVELINNVIFGYFSTPAINFSQEATHYPSSLANSMIKNIGLYSAIAQVRAIASFLTGGSPYMTQVNNSSEVYRVGNKIDTSWVDGVLTLTDDFVSGDGSAVILPSEPITRSGVSDDALTVGADMLSTVLAKAGAILPSRDAVDTRLIGMITDRASANLNEHATFYSAYLIDHEDDVGGFPTL